MSLWKKLCAVFDDAPPPPVLRFEGLAFLLFKQTTVDYLCSRVTQAIIVSSRSIELHDIDGPMGCISFENSKNMDELLALLPNRQRIDDAHS